MKLEYHMLLAWLLRLVLVAYGEWHDANMHVPFTDIDYQVFTDAARHVSIGNSPYDRLTYRYPPILAALLLPNIWLHKSFGKILFATVDVIAGGLGILLSGSLSPQTIILFVWLYNPLPAIVSTRGNADALTAALVAWSLISIGKKKAPLSGMILALAAHLRVYPILFALPMWLSIGQRNGKATSTKQPKHFSIGNWLHFISSFVWEPSRFQFIVALTGCLTLLTAGSYLIYGHEFLQQSYFYHLTRVDTRHNFSVHFYMLYLGGNVALSLLAFIPQLIVLVVFGFKYGTPRDVSFACFCQAFVFVAFNKVMTAQYFLWPLSLLPAIVPIIGGRTPLLSLPSKGHQCGASIRINSRMNVFKDGNKVAVDDIAVNWKKLIFHVGIWAVSLGLWLLFAYLLEFLGLNTFLFIWLAGIIFFGANVVILRELIQVYEDKIHMRELTASKLQ